ncbi:hypothetical protein BCS96_00280 [Vibrio breoganii]|uniref:hypothetical protein n=1 Tax=Vibrio breoganii TaxID=553239 RepID=UPI000CB65A8B|nr:hypothetical protein [Vibrio breoganii]PMG39981.1 hypothetical protein BCU93_10875 [Vibrio breoganii]PMG87396.1 hypothetical protein BCU81_10880 [Vibrio breoganii]PML79131.1 hypothetical protein BCT68_16925 [Vibrio breoganii]PMM41311.1 hypothetical protein BCT52_01580 [Vibrio breoganii]PMM84945.1 hypothetical protein BCT45_08870 [Vibrio breoganii]
MGGQITAIHAQHGHSWIHKAMANGCGFFLQLPNISGDTVLTPDAEGLVEKVMIPEDGEVLI